jgi:DNA helicase-2/ATP-dependent DNA helicase PcrA
MPASVDAPPPAATESADDLLADLTPEQRRAVTCTEGPLLILAGAGSGKTRVLTRRVAHLIEQGVEPASILAITFTNKAAGEMRERVAVATGRRPRDFGRLIHDGPTLCTFHSLCLRVLRHYGETLGVPRDFTIYDTTEQRGLMKQALKEIDISGENFPPAKVLAMVSNAKNALATAPEFASAAQDFYQRTVARAWLKYEELMAKNAAVDFDDLILRVVLGLRDRPEILKELQEHFQYLHIDEYQDTNRAQYVLAHVLAERHQNLCVVGDPDQSIYAWRGADLRNILDFETDYPKATVVRLERNYRSTARILASADALIKHNLERKDKSLIAHLGEGEKLTVVACQDEYDEAREVAERLKAFNETADVDWSDMAIFYRMNSLSRVIETELRRAKVPYRIARGTEFYSRKEIKDTLAYLRAVANPADEVSLLRILNTPTRGIGANTVKAVQAFSIANGIGVWEALERIEEVPGLSSRGVPAVGRFVTMMNGFRRLAAETAGQWQPREDGSLFAAADQTRTLAELVQVVVKESGLEAFYRKAGDEEQTQLENIAELYSAAADYEGERLAEEQPPSLSDWLLQLALVSDTDRFEGNGGAVTLMTLHAAKGLEFPVVAMLGLEEGCLPHSRARESQSELEEERRLAFVGITRAQHHLILARAQYRTMRGIRERTVPSPFLKELPEEHLVHVDRTGLADLVGSENRDRQRQSYGKAAGSLADRFRVGQAVRHVSFGLGKIVDLTPGSNAKAVIDFKQAGRKTLVLEYAADKLATV